MVSPCTGRTAGWLALSGITALSWRLHAEKNMLMRSRDKIITDGMDETPYDKTQPIWQSESLLRQTLHRHPGRDL
jgi:hypothetical protein